jgi:F0F1-type ATP synthase membrane subunit b/b'
MKAVAAVVVFVVVSGGVGLFVWVAPEAFLWVLLGFVVLVGLYAVVYKGALEFFEEERAD